MKATQSPVIVLLIASLCGMGAFLAGPGEAKAEIFKFWAAGRGAYFSGTGDVFTGFEKPFGGGLETGIEVLYTTLYFEGLALGGDQFLMTGNLGFDFSVGDSVRFHMGAYTGPVLFIFPEPEDAGGVDFSSLSDEHQTALLAATGKDSLEEVTADFDQYSEAEQDLSRTAFGWNLGRARMALDVKLIPSFYLGIAGQVGYHYMISGEEVAAGAKNEALDRFAEENNLPNELLAPVRDAVGAEEVDSDSLNGINWDGMVYLRFELGT